MSEAIEAMLYIVAPMMILALILFILGIIEDRY